MKYLCPIALGFAFLSLNACRTAPAVDTEHVPPTHGVLADSDGGSDIAPTARKPNRLFSERPSPQPPSEVDAAPAQVNAPTTVKPVSSSGALDRAMLHYELGDYDFAAEELRKIRKGSPHYDEAQVLMGKLR